MVTTKIVSTKDEEDGKLVTVHLQDYEIPDVLTGVARDLQIKTQDTRARMKAVSASGMIDVTLDNITAPRAERLTEIRDKREAGEKRVYKIFVRRPE